MADIERDSGLKAFEHLDLIMDVHLLSGHSRTPLKPPTDPFTLHIATQMHKTQGYEKNT